MVIDREHVMARARWSSAEDRLYPALIGDPGGYERALHEIRAVLGELRRRADDLPGLIASEASTDEVLACACPSGTHLPVDLLVGAACAMRAREIAAGTEAPR
jgi:hypothetical protein